MSNYTARFTVTAEVIVHGVEADNEDAAADLAWATAQEHLSTLSVTSAQGVAVHADLDGIGADTVEPR